LGARIANLESTSGARSRGWWLYAASNRGVGSPPLPLPPPLPPPHLSPPPIIFVDSYPSTLSKPRIPSPPPSSRPPPPPLLPSSLPSPPPPTPTVPTLAPVHILDPPTDAASSLPAGASTPVPRRVCILLLGLGRDVRRGSDQVSPPSSLMLEYATPSFVRKCCSGVWG